MINQLDAIKTVHLRFAGLLFELYLFAIIYMEFRRFCHAFNYLNNEGASCKNNKTRKIIRMHD